MNTAVERWEEELALVPKEMRRTLQAFEWQVRRHLLDVCL
jgi:hypothetical protein